MTRLEAAEYLRELAERHWTVGVGGQTPDSLREIANLLEDCYGSAACHEKTKRRLEKQAVVCKAAHHAGCGCVIDWTTGLPPDDVTVYQDAEDKDRRIVEHTYEPREGAVHRCAKVMDKELRQCGFPKRNHRYVPYEVSGDDHP